jgi:magnesium-transporting ATPase (P-type)
MNQPKINRKKELLKNIEKSTNSVRSMVFIFLLLSIVFKFIFGIPLSYIVFIVEIAWIALSYFFLHINKKAKTISSINNIHFIWIVYELLFIAIIAHYIGGIAWIGPLLYVLFPTYETFLFEKKQRIMMAILTIAFLTIPSLLQYLKIIHPHIIFKGVDIYKNNYFIITLLFEIGIIIFTITATSLFREDLEKKMKELSSAYNKLKKIKDNLKKRDEELKKRVKELERFYNMTVSREIKMIELKKVIKELKRKNNN